MVFKTVTSGTGYIINANKHGSHGHATFHGLECPKCKHVFETVLSKHAKCPNCGFTPAPEGEKE